MTGGVVGLAAMAALLRNGMLRSGMRLEDLPLKGLALEGPGPGTPANDEPGRDGRAIDWRWGDGASGTAMPRIGTIVRVGTARCRVES